VPATNQFAAMSLVGNQVMNSRSNDPNLSNYGYGFSNYPNKNIAMPNYSYLSLPIAQQNINNNSNQVNKN
jgi:hypothetical protein